MSIVKYNPAPNQAHTRLLREDTDNISNNALVVYYRLFELHPDFNPIDKRMMEVCKMSAVTYKKAKKELVDEYLLFVERTGGKGANIIYHIGSKAVKKILVKKGKEVF
ncbi:hypothetical protein JHD46_04255 [Sulfurimonas sp. SAG-AH-194-C20]|nr:hypothetical protein [Sulfurimonas sp. SAG-AH-194-C20]MDF1878850.1 hypothetical protein [Sulfurimonas sp. SAG-AH-194-C20]